MVTYGQTCLSIPAAARHWFLRHESDDGEKVPATVHGRQPDGSMEQYSVTVVTSIQGGQTWRLSGTTSLVKDLGIRKGDSVRLTQEEEAAATGMCLVVDKVAGQQQGQVQGQRLDRPEVRTGMVQPITDVLSSFPTPTSGVSYLSPQPVQYGTYPVPNALALPARVYRRTPHRA